MQKTTETTRSFLQHSLRLFITPRPKALIERRHIYQSLQQYGEILHFKSHFYDHTIFSPDTALVIFREKQSYDRLLGESPVTIQVERKPFDPLSLHWTYPDNGPHKSPLDLDFSHLEFSDPRRNLPEYNSTPYLPFDLAAVETQEEKAERGKRQLEKYMAEKEPATMVDFRITATPMTGDQRAHLEHTPYWGPFRVRKSMMSIELRKTVPLLGLTDLEVFKKGPPLPISHRHKTQLSKYKTLKQLHAEAVAASKEQSK